MTKLVSFALFMACLYGKQDLVARSQVKNLHLFLTYSAKPSLVKRIKSNIKHLLALVFLSDNCLLVEGLACVAETNLVLSSKDQLVLRLRKPSD